jgi:hypothetical protein
LSFDFLSSGSVFICKSSFVKSRSRGKSVLPLNNYFVIITPSLADIDADGDLDLFVSDDWGDFYFYQNVGTRRRPIFQFVTQNWQGINLGDMAGRFFRRRSETASDQGPGGA